MVLPATPPSILSAALDYAAKGYRVLPLLGKVPCIERWQRDASTDQTVISGWFRKWPTANLGILCDRSFGFAVDIDDLDITECLPDLPKTLQAWTPSGGCHLVYRHPSEALGNDVASVRAIAKAHGWVAREGVNGKVRGIDIRGKAGQIVVWPSIASNGILWRWDDPTVPIAEAPRWLVDALQSKPAPKPAPPMESAWGRVDPYVQRAIDEVSRELAGTPEGQRGSRSFWAGARLGELRVPWGEAERVLFAACESNGLVGKDGAASVRRELLRGWEQGAANPKERPERAAARPSGGEVWTPPEPLLEPPRQLAKLLPDGVDPCTDLANAYRMVGLYGDELRYVGSWGKWAVWDDGVWKIDNEGLHAQRAKDTTKRIFAESSSLFEQGIEEGGKARLKWAVSSQSSRAIAAMVQLAKSDPRVVVDHERFDGDPWTLNVKNGQVDLRTGQLVAHRREDYITRRAPVAYDPDATCPTWEAFIWQIMGGDAELIGYLQRLIGYALTGSIQEHVLAFFYGGGANGKSTFLGVIRSILGDYASHAPRGLLYTQRLAHPTELTDLCGRRFVTCTETGVNDAFDEPLVKDLTGGEPIRARRMREDFWEFKPTHKLFIAGNHKPRIHGDDDGIWRRFRLVPFTVTIPEGQRDKTLIRKLLAESTGVLSWAVRGCLEWQRIGLDDPSQVTAATAEYRKESDALGQFFSTHLRFDSVFSTPKRDITEALRAWAEDLGARPPSPRAVAAKLREMGAKDSTMRTAMGVKHSWSGVMLVRDSE